MTTCRIEELSQHVDQEVTLRGWLYNKRGSKNVQFLMLRDGSGICQCVAGKKDVDEATFESCQKLTQETSLSITGRVNADSRSVGGHEIHITGVEVLQISEDYPITPKEHSTGFLMGHRHLWLRSKKQHATIRIRSRIVKAIRDFFDHRQFTLVDAPIFTPAACEGTTTLFEVDYFDDKAYLTQSGQLYMEAAAMAHGKVYCFGPTFRAEKSKTRRHLTEFWMVEPEVAFADLNEVMDLGEALVHSIVTAILSDCRTELEALERDLAPLESITPPFPRISYDEAVQILHSKGIEFEWGGDFGAPDETAISEHFEKPVLIHRFPAQIKAFYMKEDPEDPRLALGYDMIAPEGVGEVIGGGQRAESLEFLQKKIAEHNLPEEAFDWYLDLRRYGSIPHAGFGLGLERTVAWMCGTPHVRETIPFPRLLDRIRP